MKASHSLHEWIMASITSPIINITCGSKGASVYLWLTTPGAGIDTFAMVTIISVVHLSCFPPQYVTLLIQWPSAALKNIHAIQFITRYNTYISYALVLNP